jgi:Outer membrane protein beta-barrel domain
MVVKLDEYHYNRVNMKNSGFREKASTRNGFIFIAFGVSLAVTGSAQDFDHSGWSLLEPVTQTMQYAVSPFYGYRFGGGIQDESTGSHYNFADAPSYGLVLSYAPKDSYGRFELLWSRQDSSVDFNGNYGLGTVDISIDVVQVGGELDYGSERVQGYVSVDIGATHYGSDGHGDDTKFSWGIGGGVKAFLTKNIYLRADIRGYSTLTQGSGGFIYSNGVAVAGFSGFSVWQGEVSAGIGFTF